MTVHPVLVMVCHAALVPFVEKYGLFDCTGKFKLLMSSPVMELAVMLNALLLV
jgi:hypothetical protein